MARSLLASILAAARVGTTQPAAALTVAVLVTVLTPAGSARAHHVGAYVPRDNEVSTNFKQLKFSLEARKFEVASRLFEAGALRRELRTRAATLPAGLETRIRDALQAGDAQRAETGLMLFFAVLVRELALEADRMLAEGREPPTVRVATASKFLEAIWRYYNLVDFAVTQRDPKVATGVRLAFEDAEGAAKAKPPAPERVREPLQRIARVLTGLVELRGREARL
jgi:hypothetical protein